jgi:hypothetical protein
MAEGWQGSDLDEDLYLDEFSQFLHSGERNTHDAEAIILDSKAHIDFDNRQLDSSEIQSLQTSVSPEAIKYTPTRKVRKSHKVSYFNH